ncbi:hypothetical protein BJ741DRAFT_601937 [Chytriomyces cf. hyalinus JEL632]|nr:hypothetical protein BJ741DRAFT_601937 [Chytriomyces cf. hyalinus JEL632]
MSPHKDGTEATVKTRRSRTIPCVACKQRRKKCERVSSTSSASPAISAIIQPCARCIRMGIECRTAAMESGAQPQSVSHQSNVPPHSPSHSQPRGRRAVVHSSRRDSSVSSVSSVSSESSSSSRSSQSSHSSTHMNKVRTPLHQDMQREELVQLNQLVSAVSSISTSTANPPFDLSLLDFSVMLNMASSPSLSHPLTHSNLSASATDSPVNVTNPFVNVSNVNTPLLPSPSPTTSISFPFHPENIHAHASPSPDVSQISSQGYHNQLPIISIKSLHSIPLPPFDPGLFQHGDPMQEVVLGLPVYNMGQIPSGTDIKNMQENGLEMRNLIEHQRLEMQAMQRIFDQEQTMSRIMSPLHLTGTSVSPGFQGMAASAMTSSDSNIFLPSNIVTTPRMDIDGASDNPAQLQSINSHLYNLSMNNQGSFQPRPLPFSVDKLAPADGITDVANPFPIRQMHQDSIFFDQNALVPSVPTGSPAAVEQQNLSRNNTTLPMALQSLQIPIRDPAPCVGCRQWKKKCDRGLPSCGQCIKRDVECLYELSQPHNVLSVEEAGSATVSVADVPAYLEPEVRKAILMSAGGDVGDEKAQSVGDGATAPLNESELLGGLPKTVKCDQNGLEIEPIDPDGTLKRRAGFGGRGLADSVETLDEDDQETLKRRPLTAMSNKMKFNESIDAADSEGVLVGGVPVLSSVDDVAFSSVPLGAEQGAPYEFPCIVMPS